MNILEILILGIALSIDAMIVSICYGIAICSSRLKNAILIAFLFGLFQFVMPIIGWALTSVVYSYIEVYSKWIVFIVFLILSIKFLISAFEEQKESCKIEHVSFLCLLMCAIATSIDALGAGISLKLEMVPIIKSSLMIGLITFGLSFSGFYITNKFGGLYSGRIQILGAALLFYLALKTIL